MTTWRGELSILFSEVVRALEAKQDRQAARALGTAIAYLGKVHARGEPGAEQLVAQLPGTAVENSTERFQFAPGELEELKSRPGSQG
jgi:hypothetical protein